MKVFRLYGTTGCHLCEQAASMIKSQLEAIDNIDVDEVDISDSDALFERYGVLIPVLQHPDGREIHWPFSPQPLLVFLQS